ncbi:type II secretion system F family protein [Microbacterium sp. STF-2]|uniref:type II secretion system F family protein n=1 Tax=Microbacterium sp. STF-2 TaxID=3031132 RepID=UPI002AFF8BD8|nr:type II secretion system F family protein [Microbacterium sp. STF-2]MEA1264203.1 type II secretion system F family protein [Microbacterium sp. STF-2]
MTVFVGALLAAGVLLCLSPWMWPRSDAVEVATRRGRIVRLIEEAGFDRLSRRALLVIVTAAGLIAASVAWLLTGIAVLALLAGVAGAVAPIVLLRGRRARLRRLRRQLWPDVCDLLIAAIRVGLSLPDAMASLAESAPKTLRPAFVVFARDLRASGRFETSLDRLKSTLADPVGDRIAETLRMARQVGGTELINVLRALSSSVRADAALRGEVEARQSWIRGAAVLGAIAPWVIMGLLVLRPEGAAAYGTPEGMLVICLGAAVSVVAFHIMVRIGRLPEPRRWFG